jgi:hypothetical protein
LYTDVAKGEGGFIQDLLHTTNPDPISFKDQKVYAAGLVSTSADPKHRLVEGESDVYAKVGENFSGFVKKQKSTLTRGPAYKDLQLSFIKAAATELNQKKATIDAVCGGIAAPMGINAKHYIETVTDEATLVENFDEFNKYITASFGVKGKLGKKAFTISTSDADLLKGFGEAAKGFGEKIDAVDAQIKTVRKNLDDRIASPGMVGGISADQVARYQERRKDFDKRIKPIEDVLERARHLQGQLAAEAARKSTDRFRMENMLREMTTLSSSLGHQRYGGGIYNQYLRNVNREYFEKDAALRRDYFSVTTVNPVTGKTERVMSQGFFSIDPIYRYSKGQYLRQDGGDLIETLIKGEYFEKRYWYGKWRNYTQAFTPGYWTKKVLERNGYFGLVYGGADDEADYFLNKKIDGDETWQAHAGNLILRPFTRKHRFKASFDVSYTGGSLRSNGRLEGGAYLGRLNKAWVRSEQHKLVGIVDPVTGEWLSTGTSAAQKRAFVDLLNGNTAAFETATGLKFQMGGPTPDYKWATEGAALFDKRILKNKKLVKSLGLELDVSGKIIQNDKNVAILDGLFKKLGEMDKEPATISPFLGRVGLFNYLSAKLTKIQQLETKLLAKFISPFIKLREGIKNLAGKLFRKALYAVIGSATGGVGAFLMKAIAPLLEKVFNATIARFMKYFGDGVAKAFKAAIRGDIDKMFEALAEQAAKMMAWALACGCSIPALMLALILLIFIPIAGSIPPAGHTPTPPSGSSTPTPVPPGVTAGSKFFRSGCNRATTICGSFNNVSGCGGHGTNTYWGTYAKSCAYNIPTSSIVGPFGLRGTKLPGFWCSLTTPPRVSLSPPWAITALNTGPQYGYAADYSPLCSGETTVYAPGFDGITAWTFIRAVDSGNGTGYMVVLRSVGGPSTYTMLVLHLSGYTSTSPIAVGQSFGVLFPHPAGPHVHIELKRGSTVLEPETILDI